MKVLHTIPSLDPLDGGPPEAVKHMVRALRLEGVHAEIATTTYGVANTLAGQHGEVTLFEGLPVRFFKQSRWLSRYGFSIDMAHWLSEHVQDYDVIHIHAVMSPLSSVAMRAARRAGVPYVVRPLGLLSPWSLKQRAWKKKLYMCCVDAANLACAQAFHCTSIPEATDVTKIYPCSRTWVIPHGVCVLPEISNAHERLAEKAGFSKEDVLLLFLGRLHHKKGINLLVAALAKIIDERYGLIVAGEGDPVFMSALRDQITSLGLENRVRFIGFVEGEEKQLALQGSDAFVLTSHHENFGIAALESLAAGTPVIVSEHVDLATAVKQHCVGWVTSLAPDELVTTLRDFFAKRLPCPDFASRANELMARDYSWRNSALHLRNYYEAIQMQS